MTLTPFEAGQVLAAARLVDNRNWDETTAVAWAAMITSDISVVQALSAVSAHYSRTRDFLMPSDINNLVRAVKDRNRAMLHAAGQPDFPSGLTWSQENAYRASFQRRIIAGDSRTEAHSFVDAEFGAIRLPEIAAPPAVAVEVNKILARVSRGRGLPEQLLDGDAADD